MQGVGSLRLVLHIHLHSKFTFAEDVHIARWAMWADPHASLGAAVLISLQEAEGDAFCANWALLTHAPIVEGASIHAAERAVCAAVAPRDPEHFVRERTKPAQNGGRGSRHGKTIVRRRCTAAAVGNRRR